jgi:hypothetical protein
MVDHKHQPKWHILDEQRRNARAVRRKMTAEIGFNNLDVIKNEAGVLEAAVALGGSPLPSLILPRKPGKGPGPAGREDAP